MRLFRGPLRPIRRWIFRLKASRRRRGDQSQIQRAVPLAPEDRSDRRRRQHVLVDLIHEHCPSSGAVVVEVGSRFGKTGRHLLKYCPQIEVLYAVDLLKPDPARDCIAGLPRARFIQGYSHEIARRFDDGSLDLVFIDADHSRDAVLQDLKAWVPKVKEGGVIAGHDFGGRHHPGVKEAVEEFFGGHPHPIRLEANKVWWTLR